MSQGRKFFCGKTPRATFVKMCPAAASRLSGDESDVASYASTERCNHALVLRHLGVDAVGPSGNPACEVVYFGKSGLLQERDRLRAPAAAFAMNDDFAAG